MKQFLSVVTIGLLSLCLISSAQSQNYKQEIDTWHQKRVESLLSPNGWFNLEGLFWLKPGKNSFGSGAANDIVYNNLSFPKLAGSFEWENGKVNWISEAGIRVTVNDTAIDRSVIYEEGNKVSLLALSNFRWNIIKRDDKIGVRFRNLQAAAVKNFKEIKRYPVKEQWQITAHLEAAPKSSVLITNVLGQTKPEDSPGKLVFTVNGKTYQLDPILEGNQLFILFGDATSGHETYPSGRFLYAKLPDANGNTVLDFNKAINPPCAFSTFATCPLPPKQNILPVAITAGEKDYDSEKNKH